MAKISVKKVACPCCGANLTLKDLGYGQVECEFCHAIVFINREDSKDGNYTIHNEVDGKPLAYISIPLGWDVLNTFTDYSKSTLYIPYSLGFDLENHMGSIMHIETGNSFINQGSFLSSYAGQVGHTMQMPFMPVDDYLDTYMLDFAKNNKVNIKFKEEIDVPIDKYDRQKEFEQFRVDQTNKLNNQAASYGKSINIKAMYCDSACRVYECDDKIVVAYTKVFGYKYGLGVGLPNMDGLIQGITGLFNKGKEKVANSDSSILNKMADSGLLGGKLGKKYKSSNKETKEEKVKEEVKEEKIEKEEENGISFGNMNLGASDIVEWQSEPIFLLITSKDEYKTLVKKAYKQVCSSFRLSQEVQSEYAMLTQQMEANNQQTLNMKAQAQYQHGQQLIDIGRQRSAANQNYINSMMERSNRQFESNRSSYNSRMDAQDRMRDKRTEAILGVNTYIKPDGKEVEVPVGADTAWINGKGEIVGGSAGFNPGSGWTQMDKKY